LEGNSGPILDNPWAQKVILQNGLRILAKSMKAMNKPIYKSHDKKITLYIVDVYPTNFRLNT
jgi:hypothetical protein